MSLQCEEYLVPRSLPELFGLLRAHPEGKIVAGATDLIPQSREGRSGEAYFPVLIDITRVPELSRIELRADRLWVGATATFGDFLTNPLVLDHARVLAHCARQVACPPIRSQATIGGNLMNASPAADGTPALLSLDAVVHLASPGADGAVMQRALPLQAFLLRPGATGIQAGELLLGVDFPALSPGRDGTSFFKIGRRRSLIIAVVSVAATVRLSADRTCFEQVRIALGSIGPVAIRAAQAEQMLEGAPVTAEVIGKAAAVCADLVHSRSRQQYRRSVVESYVSHSIQDAILEMGQTMGVTRVG